MSRDRLEKAAARAERLLLSMPVLESLLARRELGRDDENTAELMAVVADELCAARESDGSIQGSVFRTAEHLLLLRQLDVNDSVRGLAAPSVAWLLKRLHAAGSAAAPTVADPRLCTPLLHEYRICAHHAPDALLLVNASVDLAGAHLANGARFTTNFDGRVAACALTVAALLSWGVSRDELRPQLLGMQRVAAMEESHGSVVSTNALACVALALLGSAQAAPALEFPEARAWFEAVLQILVARQRGDGTWPSADLFFVLSVIVQATSVPALAAVALAALSRPAQQLALLQQPDGHWSRTRGPWPLLIGWRVLMAASTDSREPLQS